MSLPLVCPLRSFEQDALSPRRITHAVLAQQCGIHLWSRLHLNTYPMHGRSSVARARHLLQCKMWRGQWCELQAPGQAVAGPSRAL